MASILLVVDVQTKKAAQPASSAAGEQQTFDYDSDADLSFVQSGIAEEEDVELAFDLEFTLGLGVGRSSSRAAAKPAPSLLTPNLFGSELRHRHSFSCSLVRLLSTVLVRERLSKFFGHTMQLNQRGTRTCICLVENSNER